MGEIHLGVLPKAHKFVENALFCHNSNVVHWLRSLHKFKPFLKQHIHVNRRFPVRFPNFCECGFADKPLKMTKFGGNLGCVLGVLVRLIRIVQLKRHNFSWKESFLGHWTPTSRPTFRKGNEHYSHASERHSLSLSHWAGLNEVLCPKC